MPTLAMLFAVTPSVGVSCEMHCPVKPLPTATRLGTFLLLCVTSHRLSGLSSLLYTRGPTSLQQQATEPRVSRATPSGVEANPQIIVNKVTLSVRDPHIHMHIHAYTYIHVYIHTQTHTYKHIPMHSFVSLSRTYHCLTVSFSLFHTHTHTHTHTHKILPLDHHFYVKNSFRRSSLLTW